MPRMRIMIDLDVPPFKVQGDRTRFNNMALERARIAFPDVVRVRTFDMSFANELLSEAEAVRRMRVMSSTD
jgi:hypothetical protein